MRLSSDGFVLATQNASKALQPGPLHGVQYSALAFIYFCNVVVVTSMRLDLVIEESKSAVRAAHENFEGEA